MPLYLDLDVFHMRDHKDRGGPEAGNLQQQFKNSEKFSTSNFRFWKSEIQNSKFMIKFFQENTCSFMCIRAMDATPPVPSMHVVCESARIAF